MFKLIAGPCAIESEEMAMDIAEKMKAITDKLGIDYTFKGSFDKANRTSIHSKRGLGIDEGLRILQKVKDTYNIPVATDIHESWQAEPVGKVVDIVQIPAFLCRQTDLLIAAERVHSSHTSNDNSFHKKSFLRQRCCQIMMMVMVLVE